jgi:hypothetical protein
VTVALAVVAVVLAVAVAATTGAVLAARSRREVLATELADAQSARDRSGTELARAQEATAAKQAALNASAAELARARQEMTEKDTALAAAHAREDRAGASARADRGALDGLWAIAQLECGWARRRQGLPADGSAESGLAALLAAEVERIREEVGTPGSLELTITREVTGREELLVCRSAQALLEAVARRSQAFDLATTVDHAELAITVICHDVDRPETIMADLSALAGAIEPAGGQLHAKPPEEGQLRAEIHFPVLGFPVIAPA